MVKFIIFIVALCVIQSTVAQTEDEIIIQNLVQIIGELAKDIETTVKEVPQRLPKIIKNLEEAIRSVVEDVKIVEIFEHLKNEIESLVGKGTTRAGCSKQAFDKLEDLNENTSNDIAECLNTAQKQGTDIKDKLEELMTEANTLAVSVAQSLEKCVKNFGEDASGLSTCLSSEIETIKKLLTDMKNVITSTVDLSEDLSKDIGVVLRKCMDDVKKNTYNKSTNVLSSVQNCMEEL